MMQLVKAIAKLKFKNWSKDTFNLHVVCSELFDLLDKNIVVTDIQNIFDM